MHFTNVLRLNGVPVGYIKALLPKANVFFASTTKAIRGATGSVFGPSSDETVKDADLRDKRCLITGASSGLGLEMARCISARDCNVLMACRNVYSASVGVKAHCENPARLQIGEVNLASLRSVKNFADQLLKEQKQLDIVILNAGVFGIPWSLTEDGLETTFQVNYLSQIYLLSKIESLLTPDARVVFLTSESHRYVKWPVEKRFTPTEEQLSLPKDDYTSIRAYNVSMLCRVLAVRALSYKWMESRRGLFAAHPGSFVCTRLSRNWWPYELLYFLLQPFSKSISQAASTPLYCATAAALDGVTGVYMKNRKRCDESELARDTFLSFRILELAQDMLHTRTAAFDAPAPAPAPAAQPEPARAADKHPTELDQSLITNYSG